MCRQFLKRWRVPLAAGPRTPEDGLFDPGDRQGVLFERVLNVVELAFGVVTLALREHSESDRFVRNESAHPVRGA